MNLGFQWLLVIQITQIGFSLYLLIITTLYWGEVSKDRLLLIRRFTAASHSVEETAAMVFALGNMSLARARFALALAYLLLALALGVNLFIGQVVTPFAAFTVRCIVLVLTVLQSNVMAIERRTRSAVLEVIEREPIGESK